MHAWTTTSIASRFLVDLLADAQQPVDAVLARVGATSAALHAPDFAMPLDAFRELWALAAKIQPDIGLTLVDRFPAGQMHILAHLALRSATVGAALDDVCRYATVTSAADHLAVESDAASVRFSYLCTAPGVNNPWMAEHYLAMSVLFMTRAIGRPLPLHAVEFEHAAQAPITAYVQRFGVAPEFGRSGNAITFDSAALTWPLLTHDAYLHDILERVAKVRSAVPADSLRDGVRRAIAASLLQGNTPRIEQVAQACRLSARALRERLSQLASSFRGQLDETRRDLTRDHLARGLSVNETAYLIGFSEPAAFQHACKRWFNQSAGELRRDLLAQQSTGN